MDKRTSSPMEEKISNRPPIKSSVAGITAPVETLVETGMSGRRDYHKDE